MRAFGFAVAAMDRGLTPLPSPPPAPLGYAEVVMDPAGLGGGAPIAYWRMANTSLIVDSVGGLDGSFSGSGHQLVSGLPENSNAAIDFKGTATGLIAHDQSLELSAFTLSFWVRPNVVPGVGEPLDQPLFSKDNSTGQTANNADGDFVVAIDNEGVVFVRFRRAGQSNQNVTTPAGTVEVGEKYNIIVRADNTGFDLHINGVFYGKNTTYTGAWATNSRDIKLAANDFFAVNADCVLDEIAIYDRVLTLPEILALAQRVEAPVAEDDSATVQEGNSVTINVTENDTFVGSKGDLTVIIEDDDEVTGAGDSVEVTQDNDITYTAGSVDADVTRSFKYKITDLLGSSNLATVRVTVQNIVMPPPPESPLANPYDFTTGDTVVVTSMSQLQSAVNNAPSTGRQVLIANGTYDGGSLTFTRAGTHPVVIRPVGNRGQVVINNPDWTFAEGSRRIVLANLHFNNAAIWINGNNHRITRCQFRDIRREICRLFAARDTRIDHCDYSGWASNSTTRKNLVFLNSANIGNETLKNLLWDYCYIHDAVVNVTQDSDCFMRSVTTYQNRNPGVILDHNLFRNSQWAGRGEFLLVKQSGYKIRYCTFENVQGYLQQRAGGGWEVRSCWFEGGTTSSILKCWDAFYYGSALGMRQLIIGNRLDPGHHIWVGAGNTNGGDGPDPGSPDPYFRSREGQFIGNICGQIRVGEMWSTQSNEYPALNNNLWNNTATIVMVNQQGTTQNNPATNPPANPPTGASVTPWYEYTPAVKLTPSDVGLSAPDPFDPSGPQS